MAEADLCIYVECGLVRGDHLFIDGSFIQAAASNASRSPREQLTEVAHVKRNVREYLDDLERENSAGSEPHPQDKVSTTDPDALYFSKGDRAPVLGRLPDRQRKQFFASRAQMRDPAKSLPPLARWSSDVPPGFN
jgi:hypothetical protein